MRLGHFRVAADLRHRRPPIAGRTAAALPNSTGQVRAGGPRNDAHRADPPPSTSGWSCQGVVDHLAPDLPDHLGIAEVDLADVDRARAGSPTRSIWA